MALTAYEDGLCKQCGHPLVLCRNESYDGWWEAQTTFCYASQATEQWRRSKPKDWEPEAGQLVYAALPVDSVPDQAKQNANGEHHG